jgi:hypothetical protein
MSICPGFTISIDFDRERTLAGMAIALSTQNAFFCRRGQPNQSFSLRRPGIDRALSDPIHLPAFNLRQNGHISIREDRSAEVAERRLNPGSKIYHLESQDDHATWSFWKK